MLYLLYVYTGNMFDNKKIQHICISFLKLIMQNKF